MQKLLCIVGVTATGKTSLALNLAKKFGAEIISADSRQIYRGMDIGTGKDIPKNGKWRMANGEWDVKRTGYYRIDGVRLWGYDLVDPDEEFSVAHFKKITIKIVNNILKRKKLPIIVGGAGLYVKALTEPMSWINIPKDSNLRKSLERLTLKDLQKKLNEYNPIRFREMNTSDRKNPRRLIRAIEISKYLKSNPNLHCGETEELTPKKTSVFWIGLKASYPVIYERIDRRVDARVKKGAEKEVRRLLKKGYSFDLPAMSALGYIQWKPFIAGKATRNEVIKKWKLNEHAYARRQLTWFKKNKMIHWIDITQKNWKRKVEPEVRQWYSES